MDVSRASHTQKTPQVKYPQIEPVYNTIKLKINPIGEIILASMNANGNLNTSPIIEHMPITAKKLNESQAEGTCRKMILNDIP